MKFEISDVGDGRSLLITNHYRIWFSKNGELDISPFPSSSVAAFDVEKYDSGGVAFIPRDSNQSHFPFIRMPGEDLWDMPNG